MNPAVGAVIERQKSMMFVGSSLGKTSLNMPSIRQIDVPFLHVYCLGTTSWTPSHHHPQGQDTSHHSTHQIWHLHDRRVARLGRTGIGICSCSRSRLLAVLTSAGCRRHRIVGSRCFRALQISRARTLDYRAIVFCCNGYAGSTADRLGFPGAASADGPSFACAEVKLSADAAGTVAIAAADL